MKIEHPRVVWIPDPHDRNTEVAGDASEPIGSAAIGTVSEDTGDPELPWSATHRDEDICRAPAGALQISS